MQNKGQYVEQPSGWAAGWAMFAAVMMIMMGIWWIIAGLVAIINDEFYVVTQDAIFKFDYSTWGWVHLGLGIVVTMAGFGILSGAVWARITGVILAAGTGLIAFAWLPIYPIWAIIIIAVSVLVVWALTAHGRDITRVY